MKKLILLSTLITLGCSIKEEEIYPCNCEPVVFKQNQIFEYKTSDCVDFWESIDPNAIDRSTSPVTINGPSRDQVNASKQKGNRCL